MLYTTFEVKGKEYKLRLTAKNVVDLEKRLGTNPVNPIIEIGNKGELPSLNVLLAILQASMVHYQSNIGMDKIYDIYDNYIEDGHSIMDLVPIIIDVFKTAGFIPEQDAEDNEKN